MISTRSISLKKLMNQYIYLTLLFFFYSSRALHLQPTKTMDLQDIIHSQTKVSLALTKHVMSTEAKNSNLVLSPLSVHVVLSLIAAGSKGQTLDQMLSFLKAKSTEDLNSFSSEVVGLVLADGSQRGGPRLSFANGVWIEKTLPFKPSFKQIVDTVYKATAYQVDFQNKASEVRNEVNSWAKRETNGLIEELLSSDSVDSLTRLIFANALYFKGSWNEKFDASKTKDFDFHLLDGSSVQVPFMTSNEEQYIGTFDGFKVLGLPYKQGEDKRHFTMYIYLPDAKDGLQRLVEKVCAEEGFLDHYRPRQSFDVGEFRMPKFKISFGFDVSKVLKQLGLTLPFCGGLTEMADSPRDQNLYVSSIFTKSFIEVDEEGTEAAAATAVTCVPMCMPILVDFVADHPFMYLVREDETGVVVFIGHVLNPKQGS